ncbi:hypothetical protein [Streptomyces sp. NPDC059631]|uniref:VG15 protein n=1 Tax=unclassified Streptomyces TaxID=2593676 RepID=UPI0036CEFC09
MSRTAELASERHALVRSVNQAVITSIQAIWGDVPPNRILSAMHGEAGRAVLAAVTSGQLAVAQGAELFVSASLMAQGAPAAPVGRFVPEALVGFASDARPLASLLYLPSITTARALAAGESEAVAMLRGINQLAMITATQIADTARIATSVAMAAHPRCISYVRVVKLPACARCIILAGRQYSYSTGFKRHPKCDCGMQPMTDEEWRASDSPEDLIRQMSPEEQRKRLGAAGVKALENGADLGQIVNARRGMATATTSRGPLRVTTEGTTKRGIGGKALNSGFQKNPGQRYERAKEARLMPETIFKLAGGSREHQIAMLRKHGYIT